MFIHAVVLPPNIFNAHRGPEQFPIVHRRYLMDGLLNGQTNVHPSNTDYISKNKFDHFQICNGWVNY